MKFTRDHMTRNIGLWNTFLRRFRDKEAHGLEIGTFEGRSAFWFLDNILNHKDSTMTCIDPWLFPGSWETFVSNMAQSRGLGKLRIKKAPSGEVNLKARRYDFVYVDGMHKPLDVIHDCSKGWQALKVGGLLIVDDRLMEWGPEKRLPLVASVDFFENISRHNAKTLHRGYQLILEKTS